MEVVRDNAASLLRLARRHSLCDDDAADAYQRTLEIYLRRVDRVDHATAPAWLRTVCKHEAMRLRAARQRVLAGEEVAWDERPSPDAADAQERVESLERVARAAEALQGCRPDEARAMLLRADGSSYAEIGELCGWSYAKVNRSLAQGRARFLARFAHIESGAACEGHLPVLSAIVDGEATPDDFLAVRPHLRHCASCRSTLKALYESESPLRVVAPAGGLALLVPGEPGLLARAAESISAEVGERLVRVHALFEAASASKAAAVVASTAAVAGGAATIERASSLPGAEERARPAPVARAARVASVRPVPTKTPAAATPAPSPAPPVSASPPAPAPTVARTPRPSPRPPPEEEEGREFVLGPAARAAPAGAAPRSGAPAPEVAAPAPAAPAPAAPVPAAPAAPASPPGGFERAQFAAAGGSGGGVGFER
jgi:RNA polymerase sigma factor (sigma-70 family)